MAQRLSIDEVQQAHRPARRIYHALGVGSCAGASDRTCRHGPDSLHTLLKSHPVTDRYHDVTWNGTLRDPSDDGADALRVVTSVGRRIADHTRAWCAQREPFVIIGGDHSCAVGTWSGAAAGTKGDLGLIWIDAHMDGHTPETSPSGALHGMPLAALLGLGPPALTRLAGRTPAVQPQHVWLIGVRSYEAHEQQRLTQLGVNIVYMPDVKRQGLAHWYALARQTLRQCVASYGVTIDLDAVDPVDAPGVGCPEPGGITADTLIAAIRGTGVDEQCAGLEIAELYPHYDVGLKTVSLARDLLVSWVDHEHP